MTAGNLRSCSPCQALPLQGSALPPRTEIVTHDARYAGGWKCVAYSTGPPRKSGFCDTPWGVLSLTGAPAGYMIGREKRRCRPLDWRRLVAPCGLQLRYCLCSLSLAGGLPETNLWRHASRAQVSTYSSRFGSSFYSVTRKVALVLGNLGNQASPCFFGHGFVGFT